MSTGNLKLQPPAQPLPTPASERLDSWKEIAAYLRRDESTVRRWQKEGLPVHRHAHKKKAAIFAYKSEIDVWWNGGQARLEQQQLESAAMFRRPMAWIAISALALLAVVFGWNWGGLRDRVFSRATPGEIKSIAVLPLQNLSGDPDQDYFAEGMTEALIAELGKVRSLRVISRTSVMQFKDTKKPLNQIARELNVDALVEGSVLREGSRVGVTAQLLRVRPEGHIWSERYERDLTSVVTLQSDLARTIAGEIRAELTPQEQASLARYRAVNPKAYEAYLKGRYHWNRASPEGLLTAREYFEEAIKIDPGYAPAYAGLANTYAWSYRRIVPPLAPPHEVFPKARAAALKALELDDTLAEAHTSLAYIKEVYDWDWDGAEKEYRRAIELNPNYPTAHHWYALYLTIPRRFHEAFAEIKRAEELDPLSIAFKRAAGRIYYWAGQFDLAIQQWQMTLELEPEAPHPHYTLAVAYTQQGLYEKAIASHLKAINVRGETPRSLALLAHAYGKAGQKSNARSLIAKLNARAKHEYISGYDMAIAHLGLGNKEEALRWLERAFRERDPELPSLNRAPFWWEPLRSEPRFQEIRRRMGLPPVKWP